MICKLLLSHWSLLISTFRDVHGQSDTLGPVPNKVGTSYSKVVRLTLGVPVSLNSPLFQIGSFWKMLSSRNRYCVVCVCMCVCVCVWCVMCDSLSLFSNANVRDSSSPFALLHDLVRRVWSCSEGPLSCAPVQQSGAVWSDHQWEWGGERQLAGGDSGLAKGDLHWTRGPLQVL